MQNFGGQTKSIFRNGLYYNDCKDVDEGDEDHGSGKDDVDYDEYG